MDKINPLKYSGMKIKLEEMANDIGIKFRLEEIRENIASWLALIIVFLFGIIVLSCLYLLSIDKYSAEMTEYISIVLPSITTLIGVIFGFYFSQSRL